MRRSMLYLLRRIRYSSGVANISKEEATKTQKSRELVITNYEPGVMGGLF